MKISIAEVCNLRPICGYTKHSIISYRQTVIKSKKSTSIKNISSHLSASSLSNETTNNTTSSQTRCKSLKSRFLFRNVLLTIPIILLLITECSYAVPTKASNLQLLNNVDSSQLSIESLLNNPNLEDAIQKLSQAWHSANQPTKQILISNIIPTSFSSSSSSSSSESIIGNLPTDPLPTNNDTNTESKHSRERRSVSNNSSKDNNYHRTTNLPVNGLGMNCTKCRDKDEARASRIEAIKAGILSKLGFERAPNVSVKNLPKIPPISHYLDFSLDNEARVNSNGFKSRRHVNDDDEKSYNSYRKRHANPEYFGPLRLEQDSIADEYFVSAERSIVFAQKVPEERVVEREHRAQWFAFPGSIANSIVQRATLWVYVNSTQEILQDSDHGSIVIYEITRSKPSLVMVHNKTTTINHDAVQQGGWIKIDIKELVKKWFGGQENLGLAIHSWDSNGRRLSVIHAEDVESDSELRPFIEIQVDSAAESRRQKRMATLTCDDRTDEVRCCRYPLTIDFVEFGWEWVIAPKRYEANYCAGECSLFSMTGAFPHTHLMRQSNASARNGKGANDKLPGNRGGCCSPRKMSPISMLYLDNNMNVIYGILPNMVVDQCDCS